MRHNPASGAIVIMLRSLKMHGMAQSVAELTEQGSPAFEAAMPILSQLLKAETAEREVRSTAYQLKAARFPAYRDLTGFDFASSEINEALVRQLHRCEFIDDANNIVLVGGPGTGKTHIATAIVENGRNVEMGDVLAVLDSREADAEVADLTSGFNAYHAEAMRRQAATSAVAARDLSIVPPIAWDSGIPEGIRLREANVLAADLEQVRAAKSVFQVHAITESGRVVLRRALRRSQVLDFFRNIDPCLVGIEACGSAHHWANAIGQFGHVVRMMPPAYVKAYVKRNKTDAADAEAICEAVTRPNMRFVPIKSPAVQAASMVIKTRELFIRQRSQTSNAMRAHMAKFGVIAATGITSIGKLITILRDENDDRLPSVACEALLEMASQIEMLTARIEQLDAEIVAAVKADETARRLMTIPGVGPIIAATVRAAIQDPAAFRTGRDLAAWIGITPQANSSGGKERLGGISKRGNKQLRTLLIVGATSILKQAKRGVKLPQWLVSLIERRPYKAAAVALANKMARTIWALLVKGSIYEAPTIMVKP